jgi:hypothetical protein
MTKPDKLAALLAKVKDGKRLTKAEERFLEQSKKETRYVKTKGEVAAFFGINISALDRWRGADPDGALDGGPNGYDMDAIRAVRKRFLATSPKTRLNAGDMADEDGGDGEADIAQLKTRKVRLECDKLETQIDILRGKYALVEDVLAEVRTVIYAVKDRIRRAGPELAYEVSGVTPAEAEERINAYTHRVLTDLETTNYDALAEKLKQPNEIGDKPDRMPAARETNGRQK